MATPPPLTPILKSQITFLYTFIDFLTVSLHTILYVRSLYPPATFITTRKYNYPVHQNRHPLVCQWINNCVSSVHDLILKNTVKRVVVVIYSRKGEVMERYLIDIERFPLIEKAIACVEFEDWDVEGEEGEGKGKEDEDENEDEDEDEVDVDVDVDVEDEGEDEDKDEDKDEDEGDNVRAGWEPFDMVDVDEQLRATIRKLDYEGSKRSPLPEGCTYTVAVELRDDPTVMPPIGHPQPWIPSEPSLQTGDKRDGQNIGADLGGVKSTPIRLVEAGEFIFETWIEEGKAKFAPRASSPDDR